VDKQQTNTTCRGKGGSDVKKKEKNCVSSLKKRSVLTDDAPCAKVKRGNEKEPVVGARQRIITRENQPDRKRPPSSEEIVGKVTAKVGSI